MAASRIAYGLAKKYGIHNGDDARGSVGCFKG